MRAEVNGGLLVVEAVLLAWLLFVFPANIFSQTTGGIVQGRISDDSGSPLPGATIEARHIVTGITRTETADSSGFYRFTELRVGPYEFTVSLGGFSTQKRSGVTIQIGQQTSLDFTMALAGVSENVTVEEDAPIVELTKSSIGTTITNRQIDDLPLVDRDFTTLALLAPGITFARTEATSISSSGSSGSSNTFIIDGLSNDQTALGDMRGDFSPDAIAEFQVLSSQYNAEYGQASGAVINVISRSGSNDYHGRMSLFYRADGLAASNPFAEETPFDQTIVGGYVSGPIIKNKTFFFASYEHNFRDDTAVVALDPAVLEALGLSTVTTVPRPFRQPRILLKLDHHPSQDQSFTFRYRLDNARTENNAIGDALDTGAVLTSETGYTLEEENQDIAASHTWILSEGMLNEARFQFARQSNDLGDVACPGCPLEIRPTVVSGKLPSLPQSLTEDRYQFLDSFSFELPDRAGDHFMKAGFDFSHISLEAIVPQNFDGAFIFATDSPFNADDVSTYPQIFQVGSGDPNIKIGNNIVGLYLQDQWMLTPHLTFNLGLRWDYEDHPLIEDDKNNLGVRLHFSWDPFSKGLTSLRGGYGRYYDQIFLNAPLIATVFEPGRFNLQTVLFPGYPDPFEGGQQIPIPLPIDVSSLVPGSTPSKDVVSFGVQHGVNENLVVSVDAVYTRGHNLLLFVNTNQPINGAFPNPEIGRSLTMLTEGHSEYKALQVGVQRRFSSRYSMNLAYTLADSKTNAHGHQGLISNSYDFDSDFGPSLDDVTHTLNAAALIDAGWGLRFGVSTNILSSPPYNVVSGIDANQDGELNDRPEGVPFNSERGDALWTVNARVSKVISFNTFQTELIVEAFNLFNHDSHGGFVGNLLSSEFGNPTGIVEGFEPRQVQLGFRFDF